MNETCNVKFKIFIETINRKLGDQKSRYELFGRYKTLCFMNPRLALIYDYEKLNKYAQIIMIKASNNIIDDKYYYSIDDWVVKHNDIYKLKNSEDFEDAVRDFKERCSYDKKEAYKFIFWALIILTVDKSDLERHLSSICDFTQILQISDDELVDIINVIKIIYGNSNQTHIFKTKEIPSFFNDVMKQNIE